MSTVDGAAGGGITARTALGIQILSAGGGIGVIATASGSVRNGSGRVEEEGAIGDTVPMRGTTTSRRVHTGIAIGAIGAIGTETVIGIGNGTDLAASPATLYTATPNQNCSTTANSLFPPHTKTLKTPGMVEGSYSTIPMGSYSMSVITRTC